MFRKHKIKKSLRKAIRNENLSGIIENYEYTQNGIIKTLSVESSDPNDWAIVARANSTTHFVEKIMFLGTSSDYSLDVYDPQHKILDATDLQDGRFSEKNTRFAKNIFEILSRNYRNGK